MILQHLAGEVCPITQPNLVIDFSQIGGAKSWNNPRNLEKVRRTQHFEANFPNFFERLQKQLTLLHSHGFWWLTKHRFVGQALCLHSADTRLNHAEAQQKTLLKECHGMPRVLLQNFPQSKNVSPKLIFGFPPFIFGLVFTSFPKSSGRPKTAKSQLWPARTSSSIFKQHEDRDLGCERERLKWKEKLLKTKHDLVGGIPTPLKNMSQLGCLFPIYGK